MMHSFEIIVLGSIMLMVVNIMLLGGVIYILGRRYSFFWPWRVLLMGCIGISVYTLVSDIWWFLVEVPFTSRFYAYRLLGGRLLFSGVIWLFSWAWWQSITRGPAGE